MTDTTNRTLSEDEIRTRVTRLTAALKEAEELLVELATMPRPKGWEEMLEDEVAYSYPAEVRSVAAAEILPPVDESEPPHFPNGGALTNLRRWCERLMTIDSEDLAAEFDEVAS